MRLALVHTERPFSGVFGLAASLGSGHGLSVEELGVGRAESTQDRTLPPALLARHGHTQTGPTGRAAQALRREERAERVLGTGPV